MNTETRSTCPFCDKSYDNPQALWQHARAKHYERGPEAIDALRPRGAIDRKSEGASNAE